jgi:adenylosuccinate lyase
MDTWHHIRVEGGENDLLHRLRSEPAFAPLQASLPDKPDAERYIGRAREQVDDFLSQVYQPLQERYQDQLGQTVETHV